MAPPNDRGTTASFYVQVQNALGISELRKLRSLEDQNGPLERVVAELTLDKHMLAEALRNNV
jgi:putative transposase